jgi:tetratricopeptide (TPR) repeat protein
MAAYAVLRLWPPVFMGPVSDGLVAAERLVNLCAGDPDRGAGVLGFSPLSLLGYAHGELLWVAGQADAARSALDRSLVVARQRGETEWVAWTLATYVRMALTPDEFATALERAQEGFRTADESGNLLVRIIAREAIGIAELGLQRFREAGDTLRRALAEAREQSVALFEEGRILAHLATARLGTGDRDEARRTADEAVEVAQRQGTRVIECVARFSRAQIWRATHRPDDAVAELCAALQLAQETGALLYEGWIREHLEGAPAAT